MDKETTGGFRIVSVMNQQPRICFGREQLSSDILQSALRQGAVLLFGGRQCGKTSVLRKIADGFRFEHSTPLIVLPIFVDLMLLPYDAGPSDVFAQMTRTALDVCKAKLPNFSVSSVLPSDSGTLEQFFADIHLLISSFQDCDVRFVFLLDEAKRILTQRFPRGFQDNLFAILYGESAISGKISIVFAGAQDLYDLCQDGTSPIASRAAFHFIDGLDSAALKELVQQFSQNISASQSEEIAINISRLTGGQASLSKAIACDGEYVSNVKEHPEFVIEQLIQRYRGLLRVWAESLSHEARIIHDALLLQLPMLSLPDTAQLLQECGKDSLRADRAIEELCFTGVARFADAHLSLANAVYTAFAKSRAAEQPGSSAERPVWMLIESVEVYLRKLIRKTYENKWGSAADAMIEQCLGPDAWQKIQENKQKADQSYRYSRPTAGTEILDFTYLGQLHILIIWNKAWGLFKSMFRDRRELDDMIAAIKPVRNDEAHFRKAPLKELDRCKLSCEDLLTVIERHDPTLFT